MYQCVKKSNAVVIIFPWLGANKPAISKFVLLYEALLPGCEIVVKESSAFDFLCPSRGLKNCTAFLKEIENKVVVKHSSIIIHSMSIGCYFYSLVLFLLKRNPNSFHNIRKSIAVQVVDSPVVGTLSEMAVGVSSITSKNSFVQNLFKLLTLQYFAMTKHFTVKLYDKFVDQFVNQPAFVPSLILLSDGDPLATEEGLQKLVDSWKGKGFELITKKWSDSYHAQHLKRHKTEYYQLVQMILKTSPSLESIVISSKL